MGAYERNIVDQERSIRTQDRLNSANIDLFNKRADKKEAQEAKKAQEKIEKRAGVGIEESSAGTAAGNQQGY